ncbi:MAG: rRNA pseudouridine synthase [Cyclobacteriaceae bacterium]|jgi:23S rRNA pseudouridine2605 synthase|nr:rRNA pseudouridine synthase [Cyclobacteriaceae bacterium]
MRKADSSGPSRGRRGTGRQSSSSSGKGNYGRKPGGKPKDFRKDERTGKSEDISRKKKPFSRDQEQTDRKRPFSRDQESGGHKKSYSRDQDQTGKKRPFTRSKDKFGTKKSFSRDQDESGRNKSFSRSDDTGKKRPFARYEDQNSRKKKFTKAAPAEGGKRPFAKRSPSTGSDWKKPYGNRGKGRSGGKKEEAPTIANLTGKIRLNRYIANSGVCSRREADERIKMGLVSVNGNVVTEMGFQVNPGDVVRYEDKVLRAEKPVYILLNKPKGYITTTKDPEERNTVMNLIGSAVKERIYPVGRLDRNTTGLLLLTNDGDLADRLTHPSYQAKKIYKVELSKPLTNADAQKILEGVHLEEGRAMVDDLAIVSEDKKTVGIEIHIGWNRVVRRIFESLDYEVVKLDRTVYAGLDKKDLPRGHWRFLDDEEIVRLKHLGK